jgi:hypothetical protein
MVAPTPMHTAGDLRMATYKTEVTPGTIVAATLIYGGSSARLKNDRDDGAVFIVLPGDRGFGATQRGPAKNGCTLDFHSRASGSWGDWRDFFAVFGIGGRDAPAATLGTFTLVVYLASTSKYEVYTGCKVNRAVITGSAPGRILEFQLQIFAQDHVIESSKALTDVQSVTIGADPSTPTEALLFWATNIKVNLAGAGLVDTFFQRWTFTVDNHLERIEGNKIWFDSTNHQQTVEIHEGEREMIFEGTLKLKDATWDAAKIADSLITALTIPIDNDTVTLSNGKLVPNQYSDREQKTGEDRIEIHFPTNSLAIS